MLLLFMDNLFSMQITNKEFSEYENIQYWRDLIDASDKISVERKKLLFDISQDISNAANYYWRNKTIIDNDRNNNRIWYQSGKVIGSYRVYTVNYSPDGKELHLKGGRDLAISKAIYKISKNGSIPQTVSFIPKYFPFPFHMPYVAYDPVRPELAVACGKSKVSFWKMHQATNYQMLLGKTIQLFMCLEKPDKKIITPRSGFQQLLLHEISKKMFLNKEFLETIWNTFPMDLRGYWLTRIHRQIQKYGK